MPSPTQARTATKDILWKIPWSEMLRALPMKRFLMRFPAFSDGFMSAVLNNRTLACASAPLLRRRNA